MSLSCHFKRILLFKTPLLGIFHESSNNLLHFYLVLFFAPTKENFVCILDIPPWSIVTLFASDIQKRRPCDWHLVGLGPMQIRKMRHHVMIQCDGLAYNGLRRCEDVFNCSDASHSDNGNNVVTEGVSHRILQSGISLPLLR